MARHDRTVRLETVKMALLQSRRGVTLKSLAERHGWKLRTLYYDIEALEASGHHVIREEGRFRIEQKVPTAPGTPTADERLALYVARDQARAWKHTSLGKALDRLWHRVSASGEGQAALMPTESVPWITARAWAAIDYEKHRQIVATLERAARARQPVQARYRALSTGEVTSRVIEPGQLHWDPSLEVLYLIGWCRLREDVRIFAVHRFLAASIVDEQFAPRAETSSKRALENAFRVWRSGQVSDVRVWFEANVAAEVRERRWLPEQRIEDADGGVVVSGRVAGLEEVERWVLSWGARARVLAPGALVRRLAEEAERMGRVYGKRGARRREGLHVAGKGRAYREGT